VEHLIDANLVEVTCEHDHLNSGVVVRARAYLFLHMLPLIGNFITDSIRTKNLYDQNTGNADAYIPRKNNEFLFNTIAMHNNYIISNPIEFEPITFRNNWDINNIDINLLYHPIKNINHHEYIRDNNKKKFK
jgi:hypothetical protein